MKRLLIGIMMIMTALTVFVGCGDNDNAGGDDKSTDSNTVEFYQEKLNGTFSGSNNTTYTFADGKVTQKGEDSDEKKGSYTISESDSDGDGDNDCIAIRMTVSGHSSSYTLGVDGDNITLTEGSKKTILTKK